MAFEITRYHDTDRRLARTRVAIRTSEQDMAGVEVERRGENTREMLKAVDVFPLGLERHGVAKPSLIGKIELHQLLAPWELERIER